MPIGEQREASSELCDLRNKNKNLDSQLKVANKTTIPKK